MTTEQNPKVDWTPVAGSYRDCKGCMAARFLRDEARAADIEPWEKI